MAVHKKMKLTIIAIKIILHKVIIHKTVQEITATNGRK